MANRLKPRRGKKSTAENQKIVLEKGEVFFECPDGGVGTGAGRIMIGDGSTDYSQLVLQNKYFYNPDNFLNTNSDVSHNPVNFIDDTCDDCQTLLEHITTGKNVGSLFGSVHKLLSKHDTSINQLNNDLSNKVSQEDLASGLAEKSNVNHNHDDTYIKIGESSGTDVDLSNYVTKDWFWNEMLQYINLGSAFNMQVRVRTIVSREKFNILQNETNTINVRELFSPLITKLTSQLILLPYIIFNLVLYYKETISSNGYISLYSGLYAYDGSEDCVFEICKYETADAVKNSYKIEVLNTVSIYNNPNVIRISNNCSTNRVYCVNCSTYKMPFVKLETEYANYDY